MSEKLIFISCGQQTTDEKKLGTSVQNLIDSFQGYKSYYAEYVQNLDALAHNVFDGLRKCSGLISFLHERGRVVHDSEEWGYRSSVWVNQEIAILAYRKQFEGIDIPILVFKDKKIRLLEGAMTSLIVNPITMISEDDILSKIKSWMISTEFPSNGSVSDERFISKWQKLSPISVNVISALIDEGGINVKEASIRICLREKYGLDKTHANAAVSRAKLEFMGTDLVKLIDDINSGDEMSLHPTWKWHICREVNRLKKERG